MKDSPRRTAAWLAIAACPLAYANVVLCLLAVNWDWKALGDLALGFQRAAEHPQGAELIRASMLANLLGFYLLLIPLALVLGEGLRVFNAWQARLGTLFGLGYLFLGAAGAAVLATVLPEQLNAYLAAGGVESQLQQALFVGFSQAIYDGLWGLLNPLLGGLWWMIAARLLWQERRGLSAFTLVLGLVMLLRLLKLVPLALPIPIEVVFLGGYFVLAPLWGLWIGLQMVRLPQPRKRVRL
ncbi:MAG: hypothetical protein JXA37_02350 [Chloroflexia bacterium]|nr:hypothetical protein [Chloroflexia bacterium]